MHRYDGTTALVIVDVQNDFADPAGGLAVAGATSILSRLDAEIRAAEAAGSTIVATQDWHPASTPHFAKDGGVWPVHCVGGTWGAELHTDLRLPADVVTIRKGEHGEDGYSGFTMRDPVSGHEVATPLDPALRARSINRVVVVGLATDYCVKATALDAARLGYHTVLLEDAVAAVDLEPGEGDRAIEAMRTAGVAIETTEATMSAMSAREPS